MEEKIEKKVAATAPAKPEAAKTDAPRTDAPRTDAPRTDAPRTDAPRSGAPRTGDRPEQKRYSRPAGGGGGRPSRYNKNRFFFKKKVCFFCKNKEVVLDYKDVELMRRFIAESGKISPRRFTGTCAKHQRQLSTEIKKARQMALIPFTERHQI